MLKTYRCQAVTKWERSQVLIASTCLREGSVRVMRPGRAPRDRHQLGGDRRHIPVPRPSLRAARPLSLQRRPFDLGVDHR
jgi:hypothetical protein